MIDREELMERVDGDYQLLAEIVEIFHEDCPSLLQDIHQAVETGNAEQLVKPAHTLKGSVANFACSSTFEKAYELEKCGRENNMEPSSRILQELEVELQRLDIELQNLLKEHDS